jgi:hypothetical protein
MGQVSLTSPSEANSSQQGPGSKLRLLGFPHPRP